MKPCLHINMCMLRERREDNPISAIGRKTACKHGIIFPCGHWVHLVVHSEQRSCFPSLYNRFNCRKRLNYDLNTRSLVNKHLASMTGQHIQKSDRVSLFCVTVCHSRTVASWLCGPSTLRGPDVGLQHFCYWCYSLSCFSCLMVAQASKFGPTPPALLSAALNINTCLRGPVNTRYRATAVNARTPPPVIRYGKQGRWRKRIRREM